MTIHVLVKKQNIMKLTYHAALNLSGLNPDKKATQAEVILTAMKASGNFPNAKMQLSYKALYKLITNLHDAIITAAKGVAGSADKMHEQERILVNAFNFVCSLVEKIANENADPIAIIESAKMTVYTTSGNTAVTGLTLTSTGNGTIKISVPREKGEAAFAYYFSTDKINWVDFEMSKLATVMLTNQTPGATLYFRFVAIGKKRGAFSEAKSIIVT